MLRGRGQAQFDKLFAKPDHRCPDILNRARSIHRDQQCLGVAFKNRDAGARRAHQKTGWDNSSILEATKNFMSFLLHLLLFTGNERNDVVYGVHSDYTWRAPGSGQPLHGGHDDFFQAELIKQRPEGNR